LPVVNFPRKTRTMTTFEHFLALDVALTTPFVAVVAGVLAWRRWRRLAGVFAVLATANLALIAVAHLAEVVRDTPSEAEATHVILCWPDPRIVARLGALKPARGALVVVAAPGTRAVGARHCPEARWIELSSEEAGKDGVTTEAGLRYVTTHPEVTQGTNRLVIAAPRTADLAAARQLRDALVKAHAGLENRLQVMPPEDFGVPWPGLTVDMPILVNQDETLLKARFKVEHAPEGATLKLDLLGPKAGHPNDDDFTTAALGLTPAGKVGLGGMPIKLTGPTLDAAGDALPVPQDARSLVIQARLVDASGMTIAWARGSTTSIRMPFGRIVPAGMTGRSSLSDLLESLKLQHEEIPLDLSSASETTAEANAALLRRWGVVLLDLTLSVPQAEALKAALRKLATPPALVLVGVPDGGIPDGWRLLFDSPLEPTDVRIIWVASDTTGSMDLKTPNGRMIKRELALKIAEILQAGLYSRSSVVMTVDYLGQPCPISEYAKAYTPGPNADPRSKEEQHKMMKSGGGWEFYRQVVSANDDRKTGKEMSGNNLKVSGIINLPSLGSLSGGKLLCPEQYIEGFASAPVRIVENRPRVPLLNSIEPSIG